MESLHGWYSEKQHERCKVLHVYIKPDGTEVKVTHVTDEPVQKTGWDDIQYVGEVKKWARNEKPLRDE